MCKVKIIILSEYAAMNSTNCEEIKEGYEKFQIPNPKTRIPARLTGTWAGGNFIY